MTAVGRITFGPSRDVTRSLACKYLVTAPGTTLQVPCRHTLGHAGRCEPIDLPPLRSVASQLDSQRRRALFSEAWERAVEECGHLRTEQFRCSVQALLAVCREQGVDPFEFAEVTTESRS